MFAHTLNFGIGLRIKETFFIPPIELQSKMFYISICKVKKKKNTSKESAAETNYSVSLFVKRNGCGTLPQGGKHAE